jgi:hypothetical protein
MDENNKPKKKRKVVSAKVSYINVNRATKGYRDKYLKEVKKAVKAFAEKIGKQETGEDFTDDEWRQFFKTNLIPLDKNSELHMIELFKDNRPQLNDLLVLHNTKAGENIAEVYFKRYMKDSPTKWYDLDDFKQMANEGLVIAAEKFDPSRGNKFITFATWWMLNRVRKPNQEKGAMENHTSLSSPLVVNDPGNTTTLEEVLTQDSVSPDWHSPSDGEGTEGGGERIDRLMAKANQDLYKAIKGFKENSIDNIEKNKAKKMMGYLLSIVEQNENSYDNKQIFLYLFKKVFSKCSVMISDMPKESQTKLSTYISEAAKSKSELLKRLNMDEKEYEATCEKLTRGGYNGI